MGLFTLQIEVAVSHSKQGTFLNPAIFYKQRMELWTKKGLITKPQNFTMYGLHFHRQTLSKHDHRSQKFHRYNASNLKRIILIFLFALAPLRNFPNYRIWI